MADSVHMRVRQDANLILRVIADRGGMVDCGATYHTLAGYVLPASRVNGAVLHTFGRGWVRIDPAHPESHPRYDGAVIMTRQGWVHWHALVQGDYPGACPHLACAVCRPVTCTFCEFAAGEDEAARQLAHVDSIHTLVYPQPAAI